MELKLGKQEKFSIGQFIFVNTWWRIWWRIWYKKVTVKGLKHIYTNKPLIITANHQNAAMDALVMVGIQTRQIVWLARADIFKSKIATPILKFFKIMPIYRMRDGMDSLGNNEAIFKKCVTVLQKNKILALFPEAQHWGFRRLRQIKKAVPRIAFLAEEMSNYSLDIHIVPVGIYYENYVGFRRNLVVKIGEPYSIKEYAELYKTNPNQAQINLKNRIQDEMQKQMLHIDHEGDRYEAYEELRYMCEKAENNHSSIKEKPLIHQHNIHCKIVEKLDTALQNAPEKHAEIIEKTIEYKKLKKQQNYREWLFNTPQHIEFILMWNILKLFIALPIFIIGVLTNYLKYTKIYKLSKKMAKDEQFHNSISFSLGFLLVPISYTLIAVAIILWFSFSWIHIITIFCILLIIGVISFEYYVLAKKTYHLVRFRKNISKKDKELCKLIELRESIIQEYKKL